MQPLLRLAPEEVERLVRRDVQERLELDDALGRVVDGPQRLVKIVRQVLVELDVLFLANLRLLPQPDRLASVEGFLDRKSVV